MEQAAPRPQQVGAHARYVGAPPPLDVQAAGQVAVIGMKMLHSVGCITHPFRRGLFDEKGSAGLKNREGGIARASWDGECGGAVGMASKCGAWQIGKEVNSGAERVLVRTGKPRGVV